MKSNSASSSSAEDMILNGGMLPWLSAGGQQQQQSHININLQEKYPNSSSLRSIVEEDGGGSSVCSQLLMNEMGDSSNSFALFCGSHLSGQLPTSFKDIGADHSFSSLLEQSNQQQLVLETNDDELFHGLNGTTTTFNSDTLGALFHQGGSGNNGLFSRLLSSSTEIQPPLTNINVSCISSCLLQQQQPLLSSPTQARNRNNLLAASSSPAMSPNSSSYYYLHGGNSNRLGLGLGIGPNYSSNLCGRGGEGGNNSFVGDGLNASSLALNSMQALLSSTSNLQSLDGNQQLYSNTNNSCQMIPPKVLRPLETYPSLGSSQPTLFQKRAAHRFAASVPTLSPIIPPSSTTSLLRRLDAVPSPKMKEQKKLGGGVSAEDMAANGLDETDDGSGVLYETDEGGGGGASLDKRKGKKGIPAKNLMAERRRRKKLNDRLFMLRSVVPKISKMDRASILGDAIDYLRELLKRINDLTKELESTPAADQRPSLLQQTCGGFQAPPPSINGLFPCQVKQEFPDPSSANAADTHPIKVEVRVGEGRALNIHMVCARKPPGLLLSTMRALDSLGLDIQQAVISCFNGFALDVFQAEQQLEEVAAEEIKRVLLLTASIPATTPSPPSNF